MLKFDLLHVLLHAEPVVSAHGAAPAAHTPDFGEVEFYVRKGRHERAEALARLFKRR